MKAVQFLGSVPRYVYSMAAGNLTRRAFYDRFSNIQLRDVDPPALPNDEWVKIRTTHAGFCGSDKNLVLLHDSPSTSPFSSFPFTLGHENVGVVAEMGAKAALALSGAGAGAGARAEAGAGAGSEPGSGTSPGAGPGGGPGARSEPNLATRSRAGSGTGDPAPIPIKVGTRVLVDPVLSCRPRGIDPVCPACARGDTSLCSNFTEGTVSPGFAIGTCRDTGGGWSEEFVAHYSQLIPVPDNVSSENAVLVDAFCSSLHPVMRNFPPDDASVLVVGCGVIGISAVAAIRALGSRARIVALAKYKFQADAALAYGADSVVFMRGKGGGSAGGSDYYSELAKLSEARLLQPIMGKRVVVGGFDYVFDCVGSSTSIDDSLRFTRPGGAMVLVGLASFPKGVDWTPIWMKEVQVKGSFWCSTEEFEGRRMRTYEVAMELMRTGRLDLSPLLTHKFRLADYRHAIEANLNAGREKLIKSAFVFY